MFKLFTLFLLTLCNSHTPSTTLRESDCIPAPQPGFCECTIGIYDMEVSSQRQVSAFVDALDIESECSFLINGHDIPMNQAHEATIDISTQETGITESNQGRETNLWCREAFDYPITLSMMFSCTIGIIIGCVTRKKISLERNPFLSHH